MRVEISHVRPGDDAADGGPDANKRFEDVPESEARWIEDLTQGDIRVSPSNHAAGLQFNTVTLLALRVSSDTVRLLTLARHNELGRQRPGVFGVHSAAFDQSTDLDLSSFRRARSAFAILFGGADQIGGHSKRNARSMLARNGVWWHSSWATIQTREDSIMGNTALSLNAG